jgi:hypothetical protein
MENCPESPTVYEFQHLTRMVGSSINLGINANGALVLLDEPSELAAVWTVNKIISLQKLEPLAAQTGFQFSCPAKTKSFKSH